MKRDWIQVYGNDGNKTKDITIIEVMGMGFTQQYFGRLASSSNDVSIN